MQEPVGLSESEVLARRRHGEGRGSTAATGRGYLRILRTNLFSFFNNILFVIGITLLLLGRPTDALISVGVGLLSAVISSVQEVLGKRKLDRLRVIDGDGVAVVRRDPAGGGVELRVPLAEVVRGDLLPLVGGAQIVVDGPLVTGRVEVDESLVTGEAARVLRGPGELLLSGSRCVAGQGIQRADALGVQSFAGRLVAAARTPTVERTPLQQRVDFLIRLIMLVVAVMSGAILARAVLDGQPLLRFVQTAAVLSGLVPYGLFLLITVAYTGGAAVIGRRGVLVAQVGAVEAMSNLDMVCVDKTGTLTGAALELVELEMLPGVDRVDTEARLGGLARGTPVPGPVDAAIAAALPGGPVAAREEVAFCSELGWRGHSTCSGTVVIGAPDALSTAMVLADRAGPLASILARHASAGLRVLVVARPVDAAARLRDAAGRPVLPRLVPLAVLALREQLRPGVVEAIAGLRAQGVGVKVLSGDDPRTVTAVADAAGIVVGEPVTGPELDALESEVFDRVVAQRSVFGRVSPAHKERIVASLRRGGFYVAMIGNGVNDVNALKQAQIGVAMGSGSPVTRDVADVVLAGDEFEQLLPARHEGRRIIGGIVISMYLFLSRVATATLIIAAVAMLGLGFPYQPSQAGLSLFTVGLPSLFLTLWARPEPSPADLLRSLARFVAPVALVTALFGVGVYTYLYRRVDDTSAAGGLPARMVTAFERYTGLAASDPGFREATATLAAQTGLSIFVSITGILLVLLLAPPHRALAVWTAAVPDRRPALLVAGLSGVFVLTLATPALTDYFHLIRPVGPMLGAVAVAVSGWAVVQWAVFRWKVLDRVLGLAGRPATTDRRGGS